ncbi:hypothetical protein [Bacillus sp. V3B]|nr:hypothetical protein [Bacillus sp. V3B]
MVIVGLLDASLKESKERVLSAISLKKFLISKLVCILYMLNGPI